MAMIRCPICGERYSDTYRYCPFCEEEEAYEDGEEIRRYPQGRSASRRQPNLITPTLIVLIIIMAALLVYLLWGDKIAEKFKGDDEPDKSGVSDTIPPEELTPGGNTPSGTTPSDTTPSDTTTPPDNSGTPDGTMPSGPDATTPGDVSGGNVPSANGGDVPSGTVPSSGTMTYAQAAALPSGLTLSSTDFTRDVSQGAVQLRVSGGNGTYTWISEDTSIATVDNTGSVTPISSGTTHVAVTDGSRRAICIVRVRGSASTATPSTTTPSTTTPSTTTPSTSGGSLRAGSAVVVNGGNGVRVRSGPGTSHDILATIPNGGSVQIVQSAGDGWYEITFTAVGGVTTTGYMKGDYLSNT